MHDAGGRRDPRRRARLGQHRPPECTRELVEGGPVDRRGPGHDHAPVAGERAQLVGQLHARRGGRCACRRAGRHHPGPTAASRRQGSGRAHEWLLERKVQVNGAGPRHPGRGVRPPREGAPSRHRPGVGHAGIAEPAHGASEQVHLVDGLGRAHVAQLRGPIRGAGQQRHAGEVGLDDGRVQLGGRGAAGGEDDRRPAGGEPQAEGQERSRALVVVDLEGDLRPLGQRQRQRGGARARAHDGVPHPAAHPLVDQRGGERGLHVGWGGGLVGSDSHERSP